LPEELTMEYKQIAARPLSTEEIEALTALMRSNESFVVRQRAHGVLLLFNNGRSYEDVADIFDVHPNTVRNWAERWTGARIDGLYDRPGRGPKPMFTAVEEELIVACVEREPRSLQAALPEIERLTGKRPSLDTLRKLLKRHGKVWKRQRKIPKGTPTPEEYAQGEADLQELARLAADGEFALIFFDESGFSLMPAVPYAWQDRGRTATLGIPASRSARIEELGFLNPATGALRLFAHRGSVNSTLVIDVLDIYCDELEQPAVVVLDNAPVHVAKAVLDKRPEWERRGMTLYFLPRYSPQLNPVEILWRRMKYAWMPRWAYTSVGALQDALREITNGFGKCYGIEFAH
jgi:transposase